ncbi:hypothetical protein NTGHW29_590080 [Candidatus Nitrotoga sp. HW29]|nr:hypothetical protein NTGHW29_590080 [Candidatus Nitrotoga sp. HW29]
MVVVDYHEFNTYAQAITQLNIFKILKVGVYFTVQILV